MLRTGPDNPRTFRVYISSLAPFSEWQAAFQRIPHLRAVPLPSLATNDNGFSLESCTARLVPRHLFALAVPPGLNPYALHTHVVPSCVEFYPRDHAPLPSPVAVECLRRLGRHRYIADLALAKNHDDYVVLIAELLAPVAEDGEGELLCWDAIAAIAQQPPPYVLAPTRHVSATAATTPTPIYGRCGAYCVLGCCSRPARAAHARTFTPHSADEAEEAVAVVTPVLGIEPLSVEEAEEVERAESYYRDLQYMREVEYDSTTSDDINFSDDISSS